MSKRAFTLMELLLVVAILAIISAASAPTFSSGSADALEQARKSNLFSAYQNAASGANMMMALNVANYTKTSGLGSNTYKEKLLPENLSLDAKNQWNYGTYQKPVVRNLNYFMPVGSRCFHSISGKQYFISAKIGKNQNVVFYYVDPLFNNNGDQLKNLEYYHGSAADSRNLAADHEIHIKENSDLEKCINDLWEKLKNT